MKPRDYCCCAIPIMNAGIYATIFEQFLLALLVAILAVSTPGLVGAYVPGYGKWILAIVCFVGAAVQSIGFIGVFQEKATMFRRYTTLHILLTVAAFAVSLTWIIISASSHSHAVNTCKKNFFANDTSTAASDVSTSGEDQTLCNIFTWTDVGLMGGLWVVLAIMQFYLYTVISSYGTGQRIDHEKYRSIYSVTDIPMVANAGDPWDARPSVDGGARRGGGHSRSPSTGSVSTVMGEKMQDPNSYNDRPSTSSYPPQRRLTRSSLGQRSIDDTRSMPSNPAMAYTQDPVPTPYGYDTHQTSYYAADGVNRPGPAQSHPAEGSFGRKTPRLQKPDGRDYY